jgi:hypothetical protein
MVKQRRNGFSAATGGYFSLQIRIGRRRRLLLT